MSRVLIDASLPDRLRTASEVTELMDEAGRVLGVYTPIRTHVPPPGCQFPITDAELDRRNQVRTGRPLADILRDREPVAPADGWQRPAPGLLKGQIVHMAEDFDSQLDDLREYME